MALGRGKLALPPEDELLDGLEFDDELDLDVEPEFDEAPGLRLELDTFFALGRGKFGLD